MSTKRVAQQGSGEKRFSLYNGGELNNILTKDLVNNEVAIKQLINDYNLKSKEIQGLREKEVVLQSELDHQKTSPFYAIVSAIVNVVGTIIIGYGINLLTSGTNSVGLIILGGILILTSNIQTICHRWVRQWFAPPIVRKTRQSSPEDNEFNEGLT